MDDYPTYEAWIKIFDMDTDTPDMAKLEAAHNHKLPVWIKGNVYFNGAKAYKNEICHRIDNEHTVTVDVDCSDGNPVLSTNLYDYLDDFSVGMVNSDILGYAFEPEERFENPDGTDIVFDRDYFGSHRGLTSFRDRSPPKRTSAKNSFKKVSDRGSCLPYPMPYFSQRYASISLIRLTISMALSAQSYPLLPAFVPARSMACSILSVVSTPNNTGTPVDSPTDAMPLDTSLHT